MCFFHSSDIHACRCVPCSLKLSILFSAQKKKIILLFSLFGFCDSVYALHSDYSNRTKAHGGKSQFFVTLFLLKKSVFLVVSEEKGIKEKKKL